MNVLLKYCVIQILMSVNCIDSNYQLGDLFV